MSNVGIGLTPVKQKLPIQEITPLNVVEIESDSLAGKPFMDFKDVLKNQGIQIKFVSSTMKVI